jgi:hypothetical protein
VDPSKQVKKLAVFVVVLWMGILKRSAHIIAVKNSGGLHVMLRELQRYVSSTVEQSAEERA